MRSCFSSVFSGSRARCRGVAEQGARGNRRLRVEPLERRQLLSVGAPSMELTPIATYRTGVFDEAATEIVAYDPYRDQIYSTNLNDHTIDVLRIKNLRVPRYSGDPLPSDVPSLPAGQVKQVDMADYLAGDLTSVYTKNGLVAVCARDDAEPGQVALFRSAHKGLRYIDTVTVGVGPDCVTFSPDGKKILTANEGAPNDDYSVDPEGSVSIIDVRSLLRGKGQDAVTTIGFEAWNGQEDTLRAAGVRIFGPTDVPERSASQDLEPEYVTVAPDSQTAFVTLQENNAIAVVDIDNATITAIKGLGTKDHSIEGQGLDASNKDDQINITTWPVQGFYDPDGATTYVVDGEVYVLTANEGDVRDLEEERVADLTLDPTAFPDATELQDNAQLGRLIVSSVAGDVDGDGDHDELYSFGGRSFSIWDADLNQVYDSGDGFEQKTAELVPDGFNATNDENNFDNRSDDKGPEPSSVAVGKIGGKSYAFTTLERVGGVMVYDVSDPTEGEFVTYVNNRDFNVDIWVEDPTDPEEEILGPDWQDAGDLHVEGLVFVPACDSPTHRPLVITANEVSGTVTIFEVRMRQHDGDDDDGDDDGDFDDDGDRWSCKWAWDFAFQNWNRRRTSDDDSLERTLDMLMAAD